MCNQKECNSTNNKPIKKEMREGIQVNSDKSTTCTKSVSYTHLDVYKRQQRGGKTNQ